VTWRPFDLYDETVTPGGGRLQMGFKVWAQEKRDAHVTARIHFHILLRGMGWSVYTGEDKQDDEGS
jgi:hypothetical protein